MKKVLLLLSAMLISCADASKTKKAKAGSNLSAVYAVLMDYDTGDILYAKKADKTCTPSSMTKLMTLYLLFNALEEGRVQLDDEMYISDAAQRMKGSRSFFKAGEKAKVEDLIRSIIVHSGNDACIIVAEGLAGDVDDFVEMMNHQAEDFGLLNTNFVNPTGMPDADHYSSVEDIAIIAKKIMEDFPQYYHYFSEKEFTVNGIKQYNRNTLIGNSLGVDGLKTGKTDAGGLGVAVSAQKNGKRLIAVVNGCKTDQARAQDAFKLLSYGFKVFSSCKIAKKGEPVTFAKVWLGKQDKVQLCAHENIFVSIPKKYAGQIKVEVRFKEPVDAPVAKDQQIGTLVYKYADFVSKEYKLYAGESVEKAGFLQRAKVTLSQLIFGGAGVEEN